MNNQDIERYIRFENQSLAYSLVMSEIHEGVHVPSRDTALCVVPVQ
jgi:hypothetical protein